MIINRPTSKAGCWHVEKGNSPQLLCDDETSEAEVVTLHVPFMGDQNVCMHCVRRLIERKP